MADSIFMKAEEVARFLGVSKTEAYRIIKRLNTELKGNGYMVISGKGGCINTLTSFKPTQLFKGNSQYSNLVEISLA